MSINKFLNNKKKMFTLLLSLLLPLTLWGCNTIEGAGTDIKQGGRALERSAEHAKECPPPCPYCHH